jgi:hypothetical protein
VADVPELEQRLNAANARLTAANKALAPKHKGGEWEEYHAARNAVLDLERQIAAANGEEYAEPLDFPVKWDVGAPLPHLLVNDYRALLAFLLKEPDPNWDGSYMTLKGTQSEAAEPLALVEFDRCLSARLGAPNDEVFEGHPLHGKGMQGYTAQRVINSRWLKELEAINSVHRQYRPDFWRDLHHYVFWFHDSTFECVARSFRVATFRESWKAMLSRMVDRLLR